MSTRTTYTIWKYFVVFQQSLPVLRITPLCEYRQGFLLVHQFSLMVWKDFLTRYNQIYQVERCCSEFNLEHRQILQRLLGVSISWAFDIANASTLQIFPSVTTHTQGVYCFEESNFLHPVIYNWFTHWQTVNHWVKSTVKVGRRFSE